MTNTPFRAANSLAALSPSYLPLWDTCQPCVAAHGKPSPPTAAELSDTVALVVSYRDRYQVLETTTGVPWWFTGLLHLMESGCDFRTHLYNGDPLTARTVNAPAGRPDAGEPPFTWEASAADACEYHGWLLDQVHRIQDGTPDWTLPTVLWRFESWNGFGYRLHGVRSPYLWAGSNLEQPGRYITDGVWSPLAWSRQIGAAVILKTMVNRGLVTIPA